MIVWLNTLLLNGPLHVSFTFAEETQVQSVVQKPHVHQTHALLSKTLEWFVAVGDRHGLLSKDRGNLWEDRKSWGGLLRLRTTLPKEKG